MKQAGFELTSKLVSLHESDKILLRYKLIVSSDDLTGDNAAYPDVYSILIIKTEDGVDVETAFFYDISRSRHIAEEILRCLCESETTPCGAGYIIYDLL